MRHRGDHLQTPLLGSSLLCSQGFGQTFLAPLLSLPLPAVI